ncbi:MAG: copper chaperone NosL [Rhodocyclaceae bacterium]|nr:copper chaperone NosL [Rhodocyclaceae bacterium]
MSAGTLRRRLLLAGAAGSLAAGSALLWHHATGGGKTFAPPAEDVCVVNPARVTAPHAFDPASGLGIHDARPIPADARCPVCGMYPARFPRWAAQIIFTDGAAHFFDSPVDLFMFLDDPARFGSARAPTDAAAIYVADFRSGAWLPARQAVFVRDSQTRGPMRGPDLPAFADAAAAQAFIAEQGGQSLSFAQIDAGVVSGLRDANHARHMH